LAQKTSQQPNRSRQETELQIGFIAQEVKQAARELNVDFHAADKPRNPSGHSGLRYAEFVPVLVKALQQQDAVIRSFRWQAENQQRQIRELQNLLRSR